jgi:wyosine [tRNA(Phe)-imidazoG37] synthetase (radical SAM superfamily)
VHEWREWIPCADILTDLEAELAAHAPDEIDWLTFVASGETTLHSGLGRMIEDARRLTDLPIAVITNGSLLYMPEVRDELRPADAVLPSLDAGEAALFRRINRPHPQATFDRPLQGLVDLRDVYTGKLRVEVMLVRGRNDDERTLEMLAIALEKVRADAVHINFPTRPPAETWVMPPDPEGRMRAQAILGRSEVVRPAESAFEIRAEGDLIGAIIDVIARHPMREEELKGALIQTMSRRGQPASHSDLGKLFVRLEGSSKAQRVVRYGTAFWTAAGSSYGQTAVTTDRVSQAKRPKPAP